jgi:hypothetical protein
LPGEQDAFCLPFAAIVTTRLLAVLLLLALGMPKTVPTLL